MSNLTSVLVSLMLLLQAFSTLQQVAVDMAIAALSQSNGFSMPEQQLRQLIGQVQAAHSQSHKSSILHINNYISAASAAAAAAAAAAEASKGFRIQGYEPHVDRGLLTVIYATGSGLEVGFLAAPASTSQVHAEE